jgi:hypothetical protein
MTEIIKEKIDKINKVPLSWNHQLNNINNIKIIKSTLKKQQEKEKEEKENEYRENNNFDVKDRQIKIEFKNNNNNKDSNDNDDDKSIDKQLNSRDDNYILFNYKKPSLLNKKKSITSIELIDIRQMNLNSLIKLNSKNHDDTLSLKQSNVSLLFII